MCVGVCAASETLRICCCFICLLSLWLVYNCVNLVTPSLVFPASIYLLSVCNFVFLRVRLCCSGFLSFSLLLFSLFPSALSFSLSFFLSFPFLLLHVSERAAGLCCRLIGSCRRGMPKLADLSVKTKDEIGSAHVWTPVTCSHPVCRLLLEQKKITHPPF